jgi:hypothetical protein
MRFLLLALVLCASASAGAARAGFEGHWFQCKAGWEAADNFVLLEIRKGGTEWGAEWGVPYSASGEATLDAEGNLVLRGCSSWRGQTRDACDVRDPPVFLVLSRTILRGKTRGTDAALRNESWIRTDPNSWGKLARRCAMLKGRG